MTEPEKKPEAEAVKTPRFSLAGAMEKLGVDPDKAEILSLKAKIALKPDALKVKSFMDAEENAEVVGKLKELMGADGEASELESLRTLDKLSTEDPQIFTKLNDIITSDPDGLKGVVTTLSDNPELKDKLTEVLGVDSGAEGAEASPTALVDKLHDLTEQDPEFLGNLNTVLGADGFDGFLDTLLSNEGLMEGIRGQAQAGPSEGENAVNPNKTVTDMLATFSDGVKEHDGIDGEKLGEDDPSYFDERAGWLDKRGGVISTFGGMLSGFMGGDGEMNPAEMLDKGMEMDQGFTSFAMDIGGLVSNLWEMIQGALDKLGGWLDDKFGPSENGGTQTEVKVTNDAENGPSTKRGITAEKTVDADGKEIQPRPEGPQTPNPNAQNQTTLANNQAKPDELTPGTMKP